METIIRVHKDLDADPFARIDKVPINDPEKSWKALGILVYVLSKPDGWEVNIKDLENHSIDGERAIRSGIEELLKLKYCQRFKIIDQDTKRIKKWLYCFFERPYPGEVLKLKTVYSDPDVQNVNVGSDPDCLNPHVENPHVENPHVENVPPINNIIKKQSIKQTKELTNNNNGRGSAGVKDIIIGNQKIKNKRLFNKLKKEILLMGWVGPLDEIIKYWNQDHKRVTAWVEKIAGINIANRAGLLRKSLRSGENVKTRQDQEKEERNKYTTDEYAEAIES